MANEANWPVVGSEHEWIPGDRDLKARVLELDRNQGLIRIEQVDKSDNRLMGEGYWISLKNFSTGYQPSDQSSIPALTKALKDILDRPGMADFLDNPRFPNNEVWCITKEHLLAARAALYPAGGSNV